MIVFDNNESYLFNPRNVFKYQDKLIKGNNPKEMFINEFSQEIFDNLNTIANAYYKEETLIINGIFNEKNSIFIKCKLSTSYKNNVKELNLKPIYNLVFSKQEAEDFTKNIKNYEHKIARSKLEGYLANLSSVAKEYKNHFFHIVQNEYDNLQTDKKYKIKDKNLQKLIVNINDCFLAIKQILQKSSLNGSYFDNQHDVNANNLKRILNILKQTYDILFNDLSGFSKT